MEGDVGVLDGAQGDLVLHLGGGESGGVLLDDESLDRVVGLVARPDDGQVGEGGVSDPSLGAVEHPGIPVAARGGLKPAGHARSDVGFGESERADGVEAGHPRQPLVLLFLRAAVVDRAHREVVVHAQAGRYRAIDGRHFHRDESVDEDAAAGAAVSLDGDSPDAEFGQARPHLVGELLAGPVVVDDRRDLLAHELADIGQQPAVIGREDRLDVEEVLLGR